MLVLGVRFRVIACASNRRTRVGRAMNGNDRVQAENRGRNGHVLVWEQPGLEEEDRPARKRKCTSLPKLTVHAFYSYFYEYSCYELELCRWPFNGQR